MIRQQKKNKTGMQKQLFLKWVYERRLGLAKGSDIKVAAKTDSVAEAKSMVPVFCEDSGKSPRGKGGIFNLVISI